MEYLKVLWDIHGLLTIHYCQLNQQFYKETKYWNGLEAERNLFGYIGSKQNTFMIFLFLLIKYEK